MSRKTLPFLTALSTLLLTGCASLMMSVNDRDGSDASVVLATSAQVHVLRPTLSPDVADALDGSDLGPGALADMIQRSMVSALCERGVAAVAADAPGESTLRIRITEFGKGSGTARFLVGGGWGDSSLDGTATLKTPHGVRELEIRKIGSQSGGAEFMDQTSENVEYFTSALASKITG